MNLNIASLDFKKKPSGEAFLYCIHYPASESPYEEIKSMISLIPIEYHAYMYWSTFCGVCHFTLL